jgi:hypothetical protein
MSSSIMAEREAGADAGGIVVNPFASRYTRPGAVPPLDAAGRPLDIAALLARLGSGCCVIEGLHGRGKTTLVRRLLAAATAADRATRFVQVRSWFHAHGAVTAVATIAAGGVVGIDGWERLPAPYRLMIVVLARRRRLAVIATAHRPVGLPVLARCESSPAVVTAILERLPDHGGRISPADVADAYARHRGNVRDALATLYDRFEERRGCARPSDTDEPHPASA